MCVRLVYGRDAIWQRSVRCCGRSGTSDILNQMPPRETSGAFSRPAVRATAGRAGGQFVLMAGSAWMGHRVVSSNRWCHANSGLSARCTDAGALLANCLANRNCGRRNVTGLPTQWCCDYRPGRCALAARTAGRRTVIYRPVTLPGCPPNGAANTDQVGAHWLPALPAALAARTAGWRTAIVGDVTLPGCPPNGAANTDQVGAHWLPALPAALAARTAGWSDAAFPAHCVSPWTKLTNSPHPIDKNHGAMYNFSIGISKILYRLGECV